MKKHLLTFLFLFSLFTARSQGYESIFGNTSTQWNIAREFLDNGYSTSAFTVGDTVTYQGIQYRKINDQFFGDRFSVREDTIAGKIWIYDWVENEELLIADMTMAVGDSLLQNFNWPTNPTYLKADSVYTLNNRKHIRLNYWLNWDQTKKLEFIEGIGPNAGVFYSGDGITFGHMLVCAQKDGALIYADSSLFTFGPCMYHTVGTEENIPAAFVKTYPNPAADVVYFTLENSIGEKATLRVTNAMGRHVYYQQLATDNAQINILQWPSGIYFYQINMEGEKPATGKIMVAR